MGGDRGEELLKFKKDWHPFYGTVSQVIISNKFYYEGDWSQGDWPASLPDKLEYPSFSQFIVVTLLNLNSLHFQSERKKRKNQIGR